MLSKRLLVWFPGDSRQTSIILGLVAAVLLATLAGAVPAAAQSLPLYSLSATDDQLRTLDPLTGVTLSSVTITVSGQTVDLGTGLAIHPTTGDLFATLSLNGVVGRVLVTIDPGTGVATVVGNTGRFFASMTFDDSGTLWAVTGPNDADPDSLFTVDTSNGLASLVFSFNTATSGTGAQNLAFNPTDGLLYHLAGCCTPNTDQFLETVDPANPTATPVNIPISGDATSTPLALKHWSGDMFLLGDNSVNLFILMASGNIRQLTTGGLDHFTRGLAFAGAPPACPPAQVLYGAANLTKDGPSLFYSIDPATGAPTLIGPIGFERVSGIAFDAAGVLWGGAERQDGSDQNVLINIDPCTGLGSEITATDVTTATFGDVFSDISFRPSDGVLFGYAEPNDELTTIDTSTGTVTLLGSTNVAGGFGNGIAFASDDTLFHADGVDVNTLDQTTGQATQVQALVFPNVDQRPNALDFDLVSGVLFGSLAQGFPATDTFLATVDTTTGDVTIVGDTQLGLDALAFNSVVADVEVTKVADPASGLNNGDTITYTVTVTNNGPSDANNVQVSDDIPAGITVNTVTPSVGSCAGADPIICDIAVLANGASATIVIDATVVDNTDLDNTATVTADETDPDATNNSATSAVLAASADLEIVKEADPATPVVNATFSYILTVTNNGPDPATNVVVVDDLPAGFAPDSAEFVVGDPAAPTNSGVCDIVGSQVTCDLGAMALAEEAVVEIVGVADATGDLDNNATVSADQADPVPGNNTALLISTVGAFEVTVAPTSASLSSGATTTLTVTVTTTSGTVDTDITLQCLQLSGPVTITCVFDPATVNPGSGSAVSTATVKVVSQLAQAVPPAGSEPSQPLYAVWLWLPGLALVGLAGFSGRRKRLALALALGLLLLSLLPLAGCNNNPPAGPQEVTGTFAVRGVIGGTTVVSNVVTVTVQ